MGFGPGGRVVAVCSRQRPAFSVRCFSPSRCRTLQVSSLPSLPVSASLRSFTALLTASASCPGLGEVALADRALSLCHFELSAPHSLSLNNHATLPCISLTDYRDNLPRSASSLSPRPSKGAQSR